MFWRRADARAEACSHAADLRAPRPNTNGASLSFTDPALDFSWSSNSLDATVEVRRTGPDASQISQYFTKLTNNASIVDVVPRLYGGLSVNLFVIRVDATVLYDLSDGLLGAPVGARLQV